MRIISIVLMAVVLSMPQLVLAQDASALSRLASLQQNSDTQLQLDSPKLDIIKQGCSNAQQSLKTISKKTESSFKKRVLLYGDIQKESKAMEFRLTRQGVDASELDLLIGKNQQVLDDMKQATEDFQTTVDDLIAINCQENPALFYFGVGLLREHLQTLSKNDKKIYLLVNDANNITFITLANRLVL